MGWGFGIQIRAVCVGEGVRQLVQGIYIWRSVRPHRSKIWLRWEGKGETEDGVGDGDGVIHTRMHACMHHTRNTHHIVQEPNPLHFYIVQKKQKNKKTKRKDVNDSFSFCPSSSKAHHEHTAGPISMSGELARKGSHYCANSPPIYLTLYPMARLLEVKKGLPADLKSTTV